MKIVKYVSIPVLLIASLFTCCAANYQLPVDFVIWAASILFIRHAIRLHEYFWASGFGAVLVVFSPLPLVVKGLLLVGFASIATFAKMWTAFRALPAESI
ncbi:MAG: hypothetical protein ABSC93_26465 [Bryobacteraceae bacterium]|jgi:hypothetical protein